MWYCYLINYFFLAAESEKLLEVSLCSDQPYDVDHNLCCFIDGRDCIVLRIIGEFAVLPLF